MGIGAFVGHVTASPSPSPTVTVTVPASPIADSPSTPDPTATGTQPPTNPDGTTNLSSVTPVQTSAVSLTTGTERIGTTSYQNSVRLSCETSRNGDVAYTVAGSKFLDTTIGVPNDATNAVGNTMAITFFKDGTTQLGSPLNISLGHPQPVHLDLQGAAQLEIRCHSTNDATHGAVVMDVAFGNATIGPA